MFKAVLLLLFAGMSEPTAFDRPDHEQPFVGIAACHEWINQEARRISRSIASIGKDNRTVQQWELRCVPVGPLRDAAL